eukprot:TRINITY_DN5910_c0_g1_i3.p1 TRINITY_DN5910_c0_g1~~TRINITY_DN5910_c0_g1_i3.p1  ORF type:complete len:305 (-),score=66.65 TRINITY_DN5910_c0_g1_i3:388-1302(-)
MLKGRLQGTGEVFCSGLEGIKYRVGFEAGRVVQGVALAVRVMRSGQRVQLRVNAPWLGYGSQPQNLECLVPPDSPLEFELELKAVGASLRDLPLVDQWEVANKLSREGKLHFSSDCWELALGSYEHASELLRGVSRGLEEQAQCDSSLDLGSLQSMRLKCANNKAVLLLKLGKHEAALEACDEGLALDSGDLKALCQKARILLLEEQLEQARSVLERAAELHPNAQVLRRESKVLAGKERQAIADEKARYNKMLGAPKLQAEVKVETTTSAKQVGSSQGSRLPAAMLPVLGLLVAVAAGFILSS